MTTALKYSMRLLLLFLERVLCLSHCDFLYLDCFQIALLEIIGAELNEAETDFIALFRLQTSYSRIKNSDIC